MPKRSMERTAAEPAEHRERRVRLTDDSASPSRGDAKKEASRRDVGEDAPATEEKKQTEKPRGEDVTVQTEETPREVDKATENLRRARLAEWQQRSGSERIESEGDVHQRNTNFWTSLGMYEGYDPSEASG